MVPARVLAPTGASARILAAPLAAAAPTCTLCPCLDDDTLLAEVHVGADAVFVPADRVDLIARIRAVDGAVPVVALAERGDVDVAVDVVRAGATDLLVAGPRMDDRMRTLFHKLAPVARLRAENQRLRGEEGPWALIGDSPAIRAVRQQIARIARVPRPVLVLGERGSGKELVARAIHDAGGPGRPLVVVNCAAFTEALLESELFGHERGAYTGAERRVLGRFELADGGTLFLDEIGTMSLAFQQKVLRAVEYGVVTRVGGTQDIAVHTRVIAATNADLEDRIARGTFLADLYDRLAFEVIRVPPLRERPTDIPALANHFLARFAKELPALEGRALSAEALDALARWSFPGNVRELKHIVERAACRGGDGPVTVAELGLHAPTDEGGTLEQRVEAYRRVLIERGLRDADGNRAEAARRLGLTYDQLRHWVRKYQLR